MCFRLVDSAPSALIEDGETKRKAMLEDNISETELEMMLRLERAGREELRGVLLEPTGCLSLQRKDEARPDKRRDLNRAG